MRSSLLRKVLGYAGIALSSLAVGAAFTWVIAVASIGAWVHFMFLLIAAVLALMANWKMVIPALLDFARSAKPLPDLKEVLSAKASALRAQLTS